MIPHVEGRAGKGNSEVAVRARVVLAVPATERMTELEGRLAASGFEVGWANRLDELLELLEPDELVVAVLDDSDPDWIRSVSDVVRLRPTVRPLALVDVDSPQEFLSALSAGVTGFVPPTADLDAIERSVRSLLDSGVSIPRRMVSALVAEVRHGRGHTVQTAAGPIDVTDREWEILQLLIQRRSTREMAEELFVSVGTVRSHVSVLLRKLGAVDREDAIRLIDRGRHPSAPRRA